MALTTIDPALQNTQAQYTGFKNRIINGDMTIDQRGSAASPVANIASQVYCVDRFWLAGNVATKFFGQKTNSGPAGFAHSLLLQSSSAYSVGTNDYFAAGQTIEGLNVADLGWGAAGASSVTLSFWATSTLTGTFGGCVKNPNSTRSYPFTYSLPSVGWTKITITIPGDTSGTWATDNTASIAVQWGLGVGSTYSGPAGAWAAANYVTASGTVSVVGTSGAQLYITGVQLEKGSTATSFDYRPYGTELALCQRYYYRTVSYPIGAAINGDITYSPSVVFPVTMRSAPTLDAAGNTYEVNGGSAGTPATYNLAGLRTNVNAATMHNGSNNWTTLSYVCVSAGFSAEL